MINLKPRNLKMFWKQRRQNMLENLKNVKKFRTSDCVSDASSKCKDGNCKKLNSVKGLTDTFIKTSNGFKVVNPEGYVAIDRVSGDAVKLVDRMEFSFNNFTASIKPTNGTK